MVKGFSSLHLRKTKCSIYTVGLSETQSVNVVKIHKHVRTCCKYSIYSWQHSKSMFQNNMSQTHSGNFDTEANGLMGSNRLWP